MRGFLRLLALIAFFGAGSVANAASVNEAVDYVTKLGNQAVGVIGDAKLAKPQKQAKLEHIFSDNVDVAWIGRFVMGRFWRQATEDQKKRYLVEYRKFLVEHYATRFADYTGGTFKITDSRQDGDGEFTVSMELASGKASEEPVLVDYRVRKGATGFKIFDVIVEGVSMITTQRAEFASVMTNKGIDHLISQLSTMSDGALDAKKS